MNVTLRLSSPAAIAISGSTAYVVNTISGTVTPVSTRTGHAGPPIPAGVYNYPTAITVAPGGGTAVVVGTYAGKITLIDTRTRRHSPDQGRRLPGRRRHHRLTTGCPAGAAVTRSACGRRRRRRRRCPRVA
jgi:hypothetical protein